MNNLKMIIMDVDGTLTDGRINLGENGEIFKSFNVKDGYGINQILPLYDIVPVIITGRQSRIVKNRAEELQIDEIYQSCTDKLTKMKELIEKYNIKPEQVAYIGDDCLDIECMKYAGISGCPADAAEEVIKHSDYICDLKGGNGAVREFIDWLVYDMNCNRE